MNVDIEKSVPPGLFRLRSDFSLFMTARLRKKVNLSNFVMDTKENDTVRVMTD